MNNNLTYPLNIRLSRLEIDALARMAQDDFRDIKTQAHFSLRRVLVERGYIPDPSNALAANLETR